MAFGQFHVCISRVFKVCLSVWVLIDREEGQVFCRTSSRLVLWGAWWSSPLSGQLKTDALNEGDALAQHRTDGTMGSPMLCQPGRSFSVHVAPSSSSGIPYFPREQQWSCQCLGRCTAGEERLVWKERAVSWAGTWSWVSWVAAVMLWDGAFL